MSPRSSEGTSPIWIEERVQVERFRAGLLSFFARSSRDLPWRRNPNPYRVLVSEVMLQQTRVDTVIPYFERWMDRFPTLETLAAAELDDLLVLWKGLGYYSRARRLHETVREISRRYEGEIPSDPVLLGALPGIGGYTAGAVASIAFGVPAPAVDGNVRRVFSRLFDRGAPTPSELQRWGALLVDPLDPGGFNQALMELGSLICTPRAPRCAECPVSEHCASLAAGTVEERPMAQPRRAPPAEERRTLLLQLRRGDQSLLLLRRRPDRGLLAGMWEFPDLVIPDPSSPQLPLEEHIRALLPLGDFRIDRPPVPLEPIRHLFSHLRVTYRPWLVILDHSGPLPGIAEGEGLGWIERATAEELALPVAQQKMLRTLSGHGRTEPEFP